MNPVHKYLSSIVKDQLPAFYQEQGPLFVDFLHAYYLWLEDQGQLNHIARRLPEYKSIDTTEDDFIAHFKAKYLTGVELTDVEGIKRLIKHSKDLYDSKGSERSYKLLFKLLYNDAVSVEYPNDQVLKPSYGDFYRPEYLELEPSANTKLLVGQQVTGSVSGATAFVERYVRREISGRYYDVLYLSEVIGTFNRGELIGVAAEVLTDPPKVFGSLTALTVTDGGANNSIGDIFAVSSDTGRGALARVSNVQNATGRVSFTLVDGGYGYTMNAETTVAETMIGANNFSATSFIQFEQLSQDVSNISFYGNATNFSNGLFITGWNTGSPVANGYVITATASNSTYGNMKVQVLEGSFTTAADIGNTGNTANGIVDIVGNVMATANLLGWTSNVVGVHNTINTFYVLSDAKTFVRGLSSNATANIHTKSLGSGADFAIGSISPTESLFLASDMLSGRNSGNVPYTSIQLDGKNANVGFVEGVTVGKRIGYTSLHGFAATFTNTEIIEQLLVANSTSVFPGSITISSSTPRMVVGSTTTFTTKFLNGEYLQVANSTAFDFVPITTVANNTLIYLGRDSRVTGSGLSYGKGIVVARGDSANANSTIITNYEMDGTYTVGNSTANLIIGTTSSALASLDSIVVLGGTGYDNATSVATFANGTPTVAANATAVVTNSTGGIVSITMNNLGSGYDQDANVAVSVGSGANLKVRMDYGYGFPKDPNAGYSDIMQTALSMNTYTIGTIVSLANVTVGSNYNRAPIVIVIEPLIVGYSRQNFIASISNQTGSWLPGETLTQNIASGIKHLTFSGITGNTAWDQGEYIYQGNVNFPDAFGYVYTQNSTVVTLEDVTGTFVTTSNTFTQIRGTTSLATANVTAIASADVYSTSRGILVSANATHLVIEPTSFNTSFALNTLITGFSSAATANLTAISVDTTSQVLGFNANVTSNVVTANGVTTTLEVIDSGFGFFDEEDVTLSSSNAAFDIIATANTLNQGRGEGRFLSERGWLNEAIVHDNDRYQTHSYVIVSGLSADKYETVVKNLLHVAGTRMFGDVNKQTEANVSPTIQYSSVTAA